MQRQQVLTEKSRRSEKRLQDELLRRKQTKLCAYTEGHLDRVRETTARVAELYDTSEGVGPGLKVFEGALDPSQFREQLRRSLQMKLRSCHMHAIRRSMAG